MRTVEIDWETIATNESNIQYGSILHQYDRYVTEIDNHYELGEVVGRTYFMQDFGVDEIMELFTSMVISGRTNGLVHHIAFVYFFLKKSFYNKMITRDEFRDIFQRYFGSCQHEYTNTKSGVIKSEYKFTQLQPTDFLKKLITCGKGNNTDQEEDMVYTTMLKLVQELNYDL